MEAQWIAPDSAFPPALWSSYMQFIRTTNSLEGWHNRIQARAEKKKRLNFYKLVELIYHQATMVPLQCALLCQKKLKTHATKRSKTVNGQLFMLWDLYNSHNIGVKELHIRAAELMGSVKTLSLNENISD